MTSGNNSVWLNDDTYARWKNSGRSLQDLIIFGLEVVEENPAADPVGDVMREAETALRSALARRGMLTYPERAPRPAPVLPEPKPRLRAPRTQRMDRRGRPLNPP